MEEALRFRLLVSVAGVLSSPSAAAALGSAGVWCVPEANIAPISLDRTVSFTPLLLLDLDPAPIPISGIRKADSCETYHEAPS